MPGTLEDATPHRVVAHHVVVPYPASNSSVRTRALHWIDRMGAADPEFVGPVVHGPGLERSRVPVDATVLLLRNARRFTRGRFESSLLRRACVGVYDLDDGLPWDDGTLPGLGHWWKRPWPRSLVARRSAESADRVIAGNITIANWATEHCRDVRVIPTCVEPSDYRRRSDWTIANPEPLIGWIGSPATQGYLLDIAPALRSAHDRTGMRVEAIGASPDGLASLADFVTVVPWDRSSDQRISRWDVGVMPLRDGLYERAKCGYKLLQYAAAGVPAIASPVGVNSDILAATGGLAPLTVGEWAEALIELVNAPASKRQVMAEAGFDVADAHSYGTWHDRWVDAVGWATP